MKWHSLMTAAVMFLSLPATVASAQTVDGQQELQAAKRAIVTRQPEKALKIWSRLSRDGNAEAQFQLAAALQAGRWLPKDLDTARRWYTAAAEQGHSRAQFALANMLTHGDGGRMDRQAARRWYAAAAEQKHRGAAKQLKAMDDATSDQDLLGASRRGDVARVEQILGRQPVLEAADDEQRTAFLLAAEQGSVMVLQALQRQGAQTQHRDVFGNTALLLAVRQGHLPATRWLLEHGLPVDSTDLQGNTALMLAARRGDLVFVDTLLQRGADPNRRNQQKLSALQLAVQGRHLAVEKRLKAAGGRTQNRATVRRSIERMDPNQANTRQAGWPPLALASWRGQADLVRDLLKRGARINAQDSEQHTALTRAAMRGHSKVVKLLLRAGAKAEHRSDGGRSALLHAAAVGSAATITALPATDLSAVDARGDGVMGLALQSGSEEAVLAILDRQGRSPTRDQLAALIAADMQQAAARLLASHDLSTAEKNSALVAAIARDQKTLARELLRRGADANARSDGTPVLEMAIAHGDAALVSTLLEAGAELEPEGATPALAIAAIAGRVEIVRSLLDAGAVIDVRDARNSTPLLLAVQADKLDVVRELLNQGANRRTRNRDGDSAASLARRSDNEGIQQLFKADSDGFFSGWGNDG